MFVVSNSSVFFFNWTFSKEQRKLGSWAPGRGAGRAQPPSRRRQPFPRVPRSRGLSHAVELLSSRCTPDLETDTVTDQIEMERDHFLLTSIVAPANTIPVFLFFFPLITARDNFVWKDYKPVSENMTLCV